MAKIHKNLIPTTYFFRKTLSLLFASGRITGENLHDQVGQALPSVAFFTLAAVPYLAEPLDTHKFPKITQKV
jgi:hypothetical protein